MRTADFDYTLPPELIAQTPMEPRDQSRLLVLDRTTGTLTHRDRFTAIADYLRQGDLLVLNDTRVLPARLRGATVPQGAAVELLLLRRLSPGLWRCMGRPGRRLRPGARLRFEGSGEVLRPACWRSTPRVTGWCAWTGRRSWTWPVRRPCPRTSTRPWRTPNATRRSTHGPPAAPQPPPRGFTSPRRCLERLAAQGVESAYVTLHIGPGTFRPVRTEDPREHVLDAEFFELGAEAAAAINQAKAEGRRVVCVGTTAVRLLETVAARLPAGAPLAPSTG